MKQFKKVVASALALAMVVTAIPTADAQAAAKAPKLNNTKKILYVGQSYTLKVNNLPANWKKCTYTWSTSNKSIATIKKGKYGQAASVKAVKAGKTTITTKMTYPQTAAQKKAKKKTVKTFKCAVTVKNPTLTVKASATTLAVGKTTKLSVSKAPSNAKVAFSSSDKTVATVSSNGTVKAVAPGKAVITVTSIVGTKKLTKKVTITVAGEEGITATLSNPLSAEYPNTVLVNDQAVIKVSVVESGKPVAGRTIVGTVAGITGAADAYVAYEIKGNNTAVTDANGIATFVIGNKYNVKSYDDEWASVDFKAQDANSSKTVETTVSFATVKSSDVQNINNHNDDVDVDKKDNLVPGVNYQKDVNNDTVQDRFGLATTVSMDEPKTSFGIVEPELDEFVESQQVSSADKDEHKVGFKGGYPEIILPSTSTDLSSATKKVEEINHKSEAYHTYANDSYYYTIKEDPSKLTYATINFDNVTISKYTKLVVETYENETKAKEGKASNRLDIKEYKGELAQSSFAYQVPLNYGYKGLCVKVTLKSEGQVDTAKNAGYNVKNITYVYKTSTTEKGERLPLKGATIEWSIVDTPMTAEEDITGTTIAINSTTNITVPAGGKLTKKVPAFPYTGTAVLTVYDANGKVVNYYACATKNTATIQDGERYAFTKKVNNTNDIYVGASCYEISVDELRDKVGEIVSQDGKNVYVDSKKSGRTTLEGTVKVNGETLKLDAETNTAYTSVQWNPIPNAIVSTSEAFVALLGQKIEVIAQLTDKNGNAVTIQNKNITFEKNGQVVGAATSEGTASTVKGTVSPTNASIVELKETTDSKGQAKLILKASDITEVTNITAKSSDTAYNVVLKIADKTVTKADLYWIDADLAFKDQVDGTETKTDSAVINTEVKDGIQPKVGETWEYGVKTVGTKLPKGQYKGVLASATADVTIDISNLGITMTKTTDSVGTVETNTGVNGMVKATSTKAATTKIVSAIDAKTLTDKVVVSKGTFAGTGAPSIRKKLTLNVQWINEGMTAEVVTPVGNRIHDAGNVTASTIVYVKVADAYGNPAPAGTKVTFKTDENNSNANLVQAPDTTLTTDVNNNKWTTTDANGIAKVKLNEGANPRTTVVATVDGITDDVFTQTYTWAAINAFTKDFAIDKTKDAAGNYQTVFNKDTKTITMKFTDTILDSSVVKEQFKVEYVAGGTQPAVEYAVNDAKVTGDTITLTLKDVPASIIKKDQFTVTIDHATVNGVDYVVTSEEGAQLDYNDASWNDAPTVITFVADEENAQIAQTGFSNVVVLGEAELVAAELVGLNKTTTLSVPTATVGVNVTNGIFVEECDASGIFNVGTGAVTLTPNAVAYISVTSTHTNTDAVTKVFKITVNANASAYDVEETTAKAAANAAIAADTTSLVTALTAITAGTTGNEIKTIIAAAGTQGSTHAIVSEADTDNILAADGTVTLSAGKTATFKVEISKASGTTVTKNFKVTVNAAGDKYTVTEVQ